MARLAKSIRVLMGRSELSSLVVAGASAADGAKNVERALVGVDEVSVTGLVDLSGDVDAASRVLGADSVLLVIAEIYPNKRPIPHGYPRIHAAKMCYSSRQYVAMG